MRIDIITLFPEMCERVFSESIIGRAIKSGYIEVYAHDLRAYSDNKHGTVDDTPYGGGGGMLLRAEPIFACFQSICEKSGERPHLIYMSPQGSPFNQKKANELSTLDNIAILCGHYEGVDERVLEEIVDEEISIGDFVLTGGELPALAIMDSVARLVPGVLKSDAAFQDESHYSGLLEYPQYTKPSVWRGKEVPEVLLSGHHAKIKQWQREQSEKRTREIRPDMLEKLNH